MRLVSAIVLLTLAGLASAVPSCRFAFNYTTDDLLNSASARNAYLLSVGYWEGHFHEPYVSYNPKTGYTYDGTALNYTTGKACQPLHGFSAPSKEAIHVAMLLKAVLGDPIAQLFVSKDDPSKAPSIALALLELKMNTYMLWNATFPGYGGYMPWVNVSDAPITPLSSWSSSVPALDNGELAWSIFAVAKALPKSAKALAARYWAYWEYLALTAIPIFYAGDGHIRTVASIGNISAPVFQNKYWQTCVGDCYLDDPYEGELFAVMMDLYAPWALFGYNASVEPDKIWIAKRAKLQNVTFSSKQGPLTVQRGWWFSSHEQWKYLELPYWDVPANWNVFLNGEKARTCNSAYGNIPGLYASVNDVTNGSENIPDYDGATGIQTLAFETVERTDVVTPYGSFPTILADPITGLVWYNIMLRGPSMQGPHGSTESVNINGTEISPLVTWDSKITTLLALTGGIANITRAGLQQDNTYARFTYVINREWTLAFPTVNGQSANFCLPTVAFPLNKPDFTDCPH